jgi:NADH-quinone oxidoreductase subunit M
LAFFLGFAIKVPMFPFHTWLPAAHVQAPSAGSVILASILLKMGTYGFLRFCLPMTPEASVYLSPVLLALAVASIIYGGLVALGQSDIKKLIAYSSVAHMGFAMVGIFVFTREGIEGALLVMLNHGITTGGLFMMIGAIYERSHSRDISDHLGLGKYLPAFMGFWGLFSLSSLGFPGLNSFPGEALCLIGGFQGSVGLGLVMVPGAMLGAAYMLRLLQKMTYGEPPSAKGKNWLDLNYREWSYLIPLAVFVIWFGLAPGVVFKTIDPTIQRVLGEMNGKLEEPLSPALTIGGEDAANPAVRTLLLDTTPTQAE